MLSDVIKYYFNKFRSLKLIQNTIELILVSAVRKRIGVLFLPSTIPSTSTRQVDHLVVCFLVWAIFNIASGLVLCLSVSLSPSHVDEGSLIPYVISAVDRLTAYEALSESNIHEPY